MVRSSDEYKLLKSELAVRNALDVNLSSTCYIILTLFLLTPLLLLPPSCIIIIIARQLYYYNIVIILDFIEEINQLLIFHF